MKNIAPNKRKADIKEQIHEIYEQFHQIYGAPKIAAELWKTGETISVKTVGNYMREMGIRAHWVKPYTCTTIHCDFSNSLQNILDEQFYPDAPNTVWVSDITYIWTFEGFVYLTSIMDLFSRKIISWVLSRTLKAVHVGAEMNGFHFDEQLGYYKKSIDQDTYYTLPNQAMPDYFEFVLHYINTSLDYYTVVNGDNIQIRWSGRDKRGEIIYEIYCLDEHGKLKYALSKEQKKELCIENPNINTILKEGEKIYGDIYE